jgi:exopolysaccharide biosynthesis WecB/TagA/CpsF family protein
MQDLSSGGVEQMRLSLIAALCKRGLDVTLVLVRRHGPLVRFLPSDLNVVDLGVERTVLAIPKLVEFLRATKVDILVSSLDHNNIAAMLARRISGVETRLVICQHNTLSAEGAIGWKYRAVPWLYWLLQRETDGIVAVSRGVADDLSISARIARQKISVIYNPVIDDRFSERQAKNPDHLWLLQKDCPVFVFVGRLTAQKDVFTLLTALAIVLRQRQVRLILIGEGEDEQALRCFARKEGIAHAVAFVGYQSNPLPWIRCADALVSTSRYEGLGNAIVEALACGTPVIATDCRYGPSEILLGGRLGTLIPVGDAAAVAEAIMAHDRHCANPEMRRARAQCFSADACADAHIDLFAKILSCTKKRVYALGMQFSPLRCEEVADAIAQERVTHGVHLVVTPNLDHVRRLRRADFAAAYASARLVCPDGLPVFIYARLRGLDLRRRVTGCDVFASLLRHSNLQRHRLFIVVESRTTASAAAQWAQAHGFAERIDIAVAPPGLDVDPSAQSALAREIGRAGPTILVMTLGAPVSEVFVHRNRSTLPPCWALCIGQALRIELQLVRRAPSLWQTLGMEWLWRLCHEPRRLLGRYVQALAWFPIAIWQDLSHHGRPQGG